MSITKERSLKRELRARVESALRRAENTGKSGARISEQLFGLPEYASAETIFTYVSVGREPDTRGIIERAFGDGKRVCVPLCKSGGIMSAREIFREKDLKNTGKFNIPEPAESSPEMPRDKIDLAVVPAQCFDRLGRRLGRGGGYYDRWLYGFGGVSCGLCRSAFLFEEIPAEPHDIPVNIIVTEFEAVRILKKYF